MTYFICWFYPYNKFSSRRFLWFGMVQDVGMLYSPRVISREGNITLYQRTFLGTSDNQKRHYLKSYNKQYYSLSHDLIYQNMVLNFLYYHSLPHCIAKSNNILHHKVNSPYFIFSHVNLNADFLYGDLSLYGHQIQIFSLC